MSSSADLELAKADLNASRARLRDVMMPPPPDPNAPQGKGLLSGWLAKLFGGGVTGMTGMTGSLLSLWRSWTGGRKSTPVVDRVDERVGHGGDHGVGVGVGADVDGAGVRTGRPARSGGSTALSLALGALRSWWMTHPWRQMGRTVAEPLGVAVVPLVRQHPWTSVITASVAGALLVQARPWRWRLVAQQAHLARRHAVRWAFAQAARPAVQALLATAVASLVSKFNERKSSAPAAARQRAAAAADSTAASVLHTAAASPAGAPFASRSTGL